MGNFREFFSISNHKANTTELHPKVRKTCSQYSPYSPEIGMFDKDNDHKTFIINDPSKMPVNEALCRHLNRFLSVNVLLGAAVNKQGGYC